MRSLSLVVPHLYVIYAMRLYAVHSVRARLSASYLVRQKTRFVVVLTKCFSSFLLDTTKQQ